MIMHGRDCFRQGRSTKHRDNQENNPRYHPYSRSPSIAYHDHSPTPTYRRKNDSIHGRYNACGFELPHCWLRGCPAKDATCRRCYSRGHYSRVCVNWGRKSEEYSIPIPEPEAEENQPDHEAEESTNNSTFKQPDGTTEDSEPSTQDDSVFVFQVRSGTLSWRAHVTTEQQICYDSRSSILLDQNLIVLDRIDRTLISKLHWLTLRTLYCCNLNILLADVS